MTRWNTSHTMQKDFVAKLEACEKRTNTLTEGEADFIKQLRNNWESREDAQDLGLEPWEPSSRQLNWLSRIAEKVA